VTIGLSPVVPLAPEHDLGRFSCGKPEMDEWLRLHALTNHRLGATRTYVTCETGGVVRGYHSLAASSVLFRDVPDRVRRGLGRYPVPVILLARLAVDLRFQGSGVGGSLLIDALARCHQVAQLIGVRAVVVDALDDDARRFYERYDFEPSPTHPYQLLLLMHDLEAMLG
jgi:GNAT superfamily N-acetyltransferase